MVYNITLEKTDFEILEFMLESIELEYSIKQLSNILKRPYVKIHKSIKRLAKSKIIKEIIKGKSHYCSMDYKNNVDVICFISSQMTRKFLEKNKKIKVLIEDILANITFPDYTLVLFGSFAKGSATKNSDIDIALITSSENKEKAERIMASIKRTASLNVHSFEFSYNDFIEMLKSKEVNVGNEIIKNSIIFKGYEQFYKCLILSK